MKFYTVVGSPNCRVVHAVINHLGSRVEIEYMDFFTGELKQADYLGINPNGMVPSLVDGAFKLWESNAICQYLADKTPGSSLLPSDPAKRADVLRWQCWELAHYNKALGVLVFESVAKPRILHTEPDQAKVRWATEDLQRFAPVLDGHMKNRPYLAGDAMTLADYSMIRLEYFKTAVPFDWTPYPHLNEYYERMGKAPHWASTAPQNPGAIGQRPKQAA